MTKKKQLTTIGVAAAFLLSLMLTFAPSGVAQQEQPLKVSVTIKDDSSLKEGRLLPETGKAKLPIEVTVTTPPGSACIANVQLDYKVTNKPGYASAIINPPSVNEQIQTQGGGVASGQSETHQVSKKPTLEIVTTRDAPAFVDGEYEVQVSASAGQTSGGCNWGNGNGKASSTVKNGFLAILVVNPATYIIKAGQNAQVKFPIDIENLGNGPTRVTIETTAGGANKLDSLIPPAPVILESKTKGLSAVNKRTVTITAQTPHKNGYTNQFYQINVDFEGTFDGTAQGELDSDEQSIALTVQVQGVYAPGVDPAMFLAALGAAMVGLRRFQPRN